MGEADVTTAADDADNASDQAGSNDVKTGFPVKILLIVIGILVAAAALTGGGIWFMIQNNRKEAEAEALRREREDSVSWPKAVTLRPSSTDCLKRSGRGTRRDGRDRRIQKKGRLDRLAGVRKQV